MMKDTAGERFMRFTFTVLLLLLAAAMILPILFVLSTSISPTAAVAKHGMVFLPLFGLDFNTLGLMLLPSSGIVRAYGNTILITAGGTALGLTATAMLGYVISKQRLPGLKIYKGSLIVTMLFGGGLIPTYFVVKWLNMLDSYWAMIIPGIVGTYNVMLLMRYFESIPPSLEESAKIDGANDLIIFFRIYVPISIPILLTIAIFLVDGYWNSWFGPFLYVTDANLLPVQCILRSMMQSSRFADLGDGQHVSEFAKRPIAQLQCAIIIVTILPLVVVFPFVQKYFIKGIMLGAVKE